MPRGTLADTREDSNGSEDTGRERVVKDSDSGVITPGWSADRRPKSTKTGAERFKIDKDGEEHLIKFLDPQPFAPIYQHWVATKEGRRAYVCLDTSCPLCDYGDRPKASDWFNVVDMNIHVEGDGAGVPALKVWYATADPAAAIRERSDSPRTSPINKSGLYFIASKRTASNGFPTYSVDPVKESEIMADWGIEPLSSDKLAEFINDAYDATLVRRNTKSELTAIAKQYFAD